MFARNKRMDASMSSNTIPTLAQRDSSPSTVLNPTSSMGPSAPKKVMTETLYVVCVCVCVCVCCVWWDRFWRGGVEANAQSNNNIVVYIIYYSH